MFWIIVIGESLDEPNLQTQSHHIYEKLIYTTKNLQILILSDWSEK